MKEILQYKLVAIGEFELTVYSLLAIAVFVLLVVIVLRALRSGIYKTKKIDAAKKFSIYSLTKYLVLVVSFVVALQLLGFNLSVLLAGSAALLVGLGLGMQNLFSDYISGIILLIDSSIKVGDIIEVDGIVCKVKEIDLRTTTVFTRDEKYIIVPNTDLTRNRIINWTHDEITSRFEISVGVDYGSDVALVMQLMEHTIATVDNVKADPKPFVRFQEFGDSALQFTVFFWSDEIFRIESIKSQFRIALFTAFLQNEINIPFPQRVVHVNLPSPGDRLKN